MGDKTRYTIISMLLENNYCVGALARRLNISQAAVSQQLQVLRKEGLVWGEKRGYWTHYIVNRKLLEQAGLDLQRLSNLKGSNESACINEDGERINCDERGSVSKCANADVKNQKS